VAPVRPSRRNRPDWHANWGVTASRAHRLPMSCSPEIVDQILVPLIQPMRLPAGTGRPCCFNLAACTDADLSKNGKLINPR
jgi:hypothetical protein